MAKNAIVYLDGYNFYYGCLRNGPYKWLDLVKLFKNILYIQDPDINLVKLNYFTSPALARYAQHGANSVHAQNLYHKALKQLYNNRKFEIILGSHELDPVSLPKAIKGSKIIDRTSLERVWRTVEKQTDVKIAIEMYSDVVKSKCDLIVLCTNDSDFEPVLKKIKSDFPNMEVGFIATVPTQTNNTPEGRRANNSLKALAKWTRHSITVGELADAQMQEVINTGTGIVKKPSYW